MICCRKKSVVCVKIEGTSYQGSHAEVCVNGNENKSSIFAMCVFVMSTAFLSPDATGTITHSKIHIRGV